jgi:NTP pyrophosphatase (non-canonical NTP hydrolase)
MTELSTAPVTASQPHSTIDLTQTGAILKPEQFSETIGRSILRFQDSSLLQQLPTPKIPLPAIAAMQRLTELIARLRSPDGGCPSELEQTPETLAPYVAEEAQEVLEALHSTDSVSSTPVSPAPVNPFLSVEDLTPQLLWALAHHSYTVMQLIEGVQASVLQPNRSWQSGILRLMIVLEAEAPNIRWTFDLVTQQPASIGLKPDVNLQIDWSKVDLLPTHSAALEAGNENVAPTTAGQLLQTLVRSLPDQSLLIRTLMQGLQVDFLEPQKNWQSGKLWLKFNLEFVAEAQLDHEPDWDFGSIADHLTKIWVTEDINTATLEEFAIEVELAEQTKDSSMRSQDEGSFASVTLADFASDIAQTTATPAIDSPDFATLEEFAMSLGGTTHASSVEEPADSMATLADFVAEFVPSTLNSAVEVLPTESVVEKIEVESPGITASTQTIEVESIEIPPIGTDLFEQMEVPYVTQPINPLDLDEAHLAEPIIEPVSVDTIELLDLTLRLVESMSQASNDSHLTNPLLQHLTIPREKQSLWIIQKAWEVLELKEKNIPIVETISGSLAEWMRPWRWQLTRVSYEIMRLVGGLTATILQPHWHWKKGTLRLLPLLEIRTALAEWEVDLATGQPMPLNSLPIDPGAIVRFENFSFNTPTTLAETLLERTIAQIQTTAPEIQQLLEGIDVEVQIAQQSWQSATLQLHLSLELIAD